MTKSHYIAIETIKLIRRAIAESESPVDYRNFRVTVKYIQEVLQRDDELAYYWSHLPSATKEWQLNFLIDLVEL